MPEKTFLSSCAGRWRRAPSMQGLILALLVGGATSACSSLDRAWQSSREKPYRPANFVATGPIPSNVKRLGVLPLHSGEWSSSDLRALDAAFAAELGKFDRFEALPIPRQALASRFDEESLASTGALPADLLMRLHDDFAVDALLFLDLTHYAPYQPISIGVRAKLVLVGTGHLLWSFDGMFDSAQPDVARAARKYHQESGWLAHPTADSADIFQSPARYAKYVAHAIFETMPAREAP